MTLDLLPREQQATDPAWCGDRVCLLGNDNTLLLRSESLILSAEVLGTGSQPVCVIYFLFMVWHTKKPLGVHQGCVCTCVC